MIFLIICFLVIFILLSIIPFVQWIINKNYNKVETTTFHFPLELLNAEMNNLKWENINVNTTLGIDLKTRGSVRLAKGLIMSDKIFKEKKAEEYSYDLP